MRIQFSKLVALAGAVIIIPVAARAQYTYTTLDDPLAETDSGTWVNGISGTNIVGYYGDRNGRIYGFLYNGAAWTTLDDPLAASGTYAYGISGSNIVGYYLGSGDLYHGFLYNGKTYTTLDDPMGVGGTVASGISGGDIVGNYWDSSGVNHGFLYSGGAWTTLDDPLAGSAPPQGTQAHGISGSNIVGSYWDGSGYIHGFLYDGHTWTTLDEPLTASGTFVQGISGSNIVGHYWDSNGVSHGFLYNGGVWTTLDDPSAGSSPTNYGVSRPGTFAYGISGGKIVGSYVVDSGGAYHGFVATPPVIPQLTIAQSGNSLEISWPYPSTGWTLQQNPDFTTTNWIPTSGVSNDGTNNFITIVQTSGNLFYRLSRQ
jgi:hypothetical protein